MIYLDNNATTQLDPQVLEAMQPLMRALVGNPSSSHRFGQQAKALLLESKQKCAQFFNVRPEEVFFVSGATEGLNFLVGQSSPGAHIISSSIEHLAAIEALKKSKAQVSFLDPLPGKGALSLQQIERAIQSNTQMIVLSSVNNETGIKTDIEAIADLAEKRGIHFVVDGVAVLGKEPLLLPKGVSGACFSGHKIHAPLGVGVVVVRKPFKPLPLIVGGPQQNGMRAGTENLPAIVGLTKALEFLKEHGEQWSRKMRLLRDRLEEGLLKALPGIIIHGLGEPRVSNTSNMAFPGVDGETLLMVLDLAGLAASHGSACSSGALQTSRVLLGMGIEPKIARSSLRFSLSRFTTEEEIERSVLLITDAVNRLRSF